MTHDHVITRSRTGGIAALLIARGTALTGNRMLLVVVPWVVLSSTGSPTITGLVTLCQPLAWIIMQVLAGPWLDRTGPQRVSAGGDLICAAALTVLAVAATPPVWLLAVLMTVVGAADGPAAAAKTVLLRPIAADTGTPLLRANHWSTAVERSAGAGPIVAGLLTAAFGQAAILGLAAALFAVASLASATIRTRIPRSQPDGTYREQLHDGATFLRHDRSLRALVLMFAVTNLLDQALLGVLLPVWARDGGHGTTIIGLAMSAFAGAAALTALATSWISDRLDRRTVYLLGFIVAGASRFAVLALGCSPTIVLIVWAIAGLGSGAGNPVVETVQYERIPDELQGRVRTLIIACAWTGIPFGGLVAAGLLAAGLPAALWLCGTAYLAAVLRPGWRVTWQPTTPARIHLPRPRAGTPEQDSDQALPGSVTPSGRLSTHPGVTAGKPA